MAATPATEPHTTVGVPSGTLIVYTIHDMTEKRKHDDTTVSLHPLTFDGAMAKLAQSKRGDSQAAESGSTTEPAHGPAPYFSASHFFKCWIAVTGDGLTPFSIAR